MANVEALEHDLGPLARFINTYDVEGSQEELATPSDLNRWLTQESLAPEGFRASGEDLARARKIREALRVLALANNGVEVDEARSRALLSEIAARATFGIEFGGEKPELLPRAEGIDAALGALLARVFVATERGEWARLKACAKHSCQWVFVDHSKNGSRTWCSMKVCGNRVKATKYRERLAKDV